MTEDKIQIFGTRLKKVAEALNTIKHFGLDEDLLIAWLCHKLKISEKDAKKIMNVHEEFYDKIIKKQMLNNLKEGG